MLKVVGQVYANEKTEFSNMISALESAGYEIAYVTETNATVIKEVENLNE